MSPKSRLNPKSYSTKPGLEKYAQDLVRQNPCVQPVEPLQSFLQLSCFNARKQSAWHGMHSQAMGQSTCLSTSGSSSRAPGLKTLISESGLTTPKLSSQWCTCQKSRLMWHTCKMYEDLWMLLWDLSLRACKRNVAMPNSRDQPTDWRWTGRSWSCTAKNWCEEPDFEGLT